MNWTKSLVRFRLCTHELTFRTKIVDQNDLFDKSFRRPRQYCMEGSQQCGVSLVKETDDNAGGWKIFWVGFLLTSETRQGMVYRAGRAVV